MAMSTGNFKVDIIFSSVKELQNEKSCLEQKLNHVRAKKKELEKIHEQCCGKLQQATDTNSKLQEMLKVGHHKVEQLQYQIKSGEEALKTKREAVDKLNSQINDKKLQKEQTREQFADACDRISSNLMEAKQSFTDTSLTEELEKLKNLLKSLRRKDDNSCGNINELESMISQMNIEDATTGKRPILPAPLQHTLINMLLKENETFNKITEETKNETMMVKEQRDNILSWQPPQQQAVNV